MNANAAARILVLLWFGLATIFAAPAMGANADPSVDEMIEALSVKPAAPKAEATRMRGFKPGGGERSASAPGKPGKLQLAVQFEFDSAKISLESRELLLKLASAMKSESLAALRFRIEGHTDSVGDGAYNMRLSERRARAVREFLRIDSGIEAGRLDTIGMGSAVPADPADPRAAVNRRVVVVSLEPLPAATQPPAAEAAGKSDNAAGTVERVNGQLKVRRGNSNSVVQLGARVREGDVLETASDATALIRLDDGANLLLRASSILRIEKLRIAGDPSTWKQAFALVVGAFRYVTGALGGNRPDAVAFSTAMATVGIRGTDLDIVHTEAGRGTAEAGTYVKVNRGVVSLDGIDGSTVALSRDEQAYAGPKRPVTRGMKPTPAVMRLAQPAAVFATGEMDELLDSR